MPTLEQTAPGDRAESGPAHPGPAGNPPTGVITETDIARAVADGMDVNTTRIRDPLTAHPAAIPAATSIRDAATTMLDGGFRQVPVTDGTGWIGIAEIADICSALLAPPAA